MTVLLSRKHNQTVWAAWTELRNCMVVDGNLRPEMSPEMSYTIILQDTRVDLCRKACPAWLFTVHIHETNWLICMFPVGWWTGERIPSDDTRLICRRKNILQLSSIIWFWLNSSFLIFGIAFGSIVSIQHTQKSKKGIFECCLSSLVSFPVWTLHMLYIFPASVSSLHCHCFI